MADRICVRIDTSNAACAQYAAPTPYPSVGVPTPEPPERLAETGFALGSMVVLAVLACLLGAAGLAITGEWYRVWRENRRA